MSRIKLVKGNSYTGYGVHVAIEKPILNIDDKTADSLIATGYFILLDNGEAEKTVAKKPVKSKKKNEFERDGSELFPETE